MKPGCRFLIACALFAMSCEGPQGPGGSTGAMGTPGATGSTGPQGAPGGTQCLGSTPGLQATAQVSAPKNGTFFATGEAPQITIQLQDGCGNQLQPSALATVNLYFNGPRAMLLNQTDCKMLNCVTDRTAEQHHYINLLSPMFADSTQKNLTQDADGTIHYQLAPVSSESPGTYTVGVWAMATNGLDQSFALQDLQIGTATAETYTSGPPATSSCTACHKGPANGKTYLNHIYPGYSPTGIYALDLFPIATCRSCHNNDGYSVNPAVRKVHAPHRGAHQVTPGVAHPEYGLQMDASLAEFTDVVFPALPDNEKDCAKCHNDNTWQTAPSRLACGTCHETVFFDTGTVNPPLTYPANACKMDTDCAALGAFATCNTTAGTCQIATHPIQSDDSMCSTCHTPTSPGLSPIDADHAVLSYTSVPHLTLSNLALSGGSGPMGTVMVGDMLTVTFQLDDGMGNPITDLLTNASESGTLLIGGPTNNRQLVVGTLSIKSKGTLTTTAPGAYTYVLPTPFPATAESPQNTTLPGQTNVAGTYTIYLYVSDSLTIDGQSVVDAGPATLDFKFADSTLPLQPRQVISAAACDSCHVVTQAHGGSRRDGEACSNCHTAGSLDLGVGAKGNPCTMTSQCQSFETCEDTNNDGIPDTCVITTAPTPGQTIFFSSMIHSLHFGRLLGGYAQENNVAPYTGEFVIVGYKNQVSNFSQVLLPMDVRNCKKCHADNGSACSASAPCGVGQSCVSGTCQNTAYTNPSGAVCLSCHDDIDSYGHVELQTVGYGTSSPIETCDVCHGPSAAFSVTTVHSINNPYVPPYPRLPSGG